MDYYKVFETIQRLAKGKGWSITKLAEKSELPRSTIYNIKNCKNNISLKTAKSIANALECQVTDFMPLDEKQKRLIASPQPKQVELEVWGDFTIKPQVGHCCIATKSYSLPPEEIEFQVKRYLFGTKNVDASTLQMVRSYAQTLVQRSAKVEV